MKRLIQAGDSVVPSQLCANKVGNTRGDRRRQKVRKKLKIGRETQNAQQAKKTCAETGVVLFLTITFVFFLDRKLNSYLKHISLLNVLEGCSAFTVLCFVLYLWLVYLSQI